MPGGLRAGLCSAFLIIVTGGASRNGHSTRAARSDAGERELTVGWDAIRRQRNFAAGAVPSSTLVVVVDFGGRGGGGGRGNELPGARLVAGAVHVLLVAVGVSRRDVAARVAPLVRERAALTAAALLPCYNVVRQRYINIYTRLLSTSLTARFHLLDLLVATFRRRRRRRRRRVDVASR